MKPSVVVLCTAVIVLASAVINAQQQAPPNPSAGQPPQQQPPVQAGQPSQTPQVPQTPQDAIQLRCQSENGTVPHWLDNTCRTFLSCSNFTLSMQSCEGDLVYSWGTRSCVATDQVNCTEQNLQFADIIQAFLQPHFYQNIPRPKLPLVPFAANGGGNGDGQFAAGAPVDDEDGDADEGEEGDDDDNGLTIDLDDLPSILVDNSNAFNITLLPEMCQKLGATVHQLEVSMNTALLMLTGCPETACDVPLFHLDC